MIQEGIPIDQLIEVAGNYLSKIKADVGNDVYNGIIDHEGDVTLMFAIDTSGSMKAEIGAAKAIATELINSMNNINVDYILSPFKDPGNIIVFQHVCYILMQ